MSRDEHVAFLENEVHRLTELVRLYAEEANRLRPANSVSITSAVKPKAPVISHEEAMFARDMALSTFDVKTKKRA